MTDSNSTLNCSPANIRDFFMNQPVKLTVEMISEAGKQMQKRLMCFCPEGPRPCTDMRCLIAVLSAALSAITPTEEKVTELIREIEKLRCRAETATVDKSREKYWDEYHRVLRTEWPNIASAIANSDRRRREVEERLSTESKLRTLAEGSRNAAESRVTDLEKKLMELQGVDASRMQTHAEGCWKWGPRHYFCLSDKHAKQNVELEEAKRKGTTPSNVLDIGVLLRTQDNLATDAPIFVVQKRVRDYGCDRSAGDEDAIGVCFVLRDGGSEISEEDYDNYSTTGEDGDGEMFDPSDWEEVAYRERWEYVTACFTKKGAEDYIASNGHNLGKTRIWCDTSYRNQEMREVRKFLMELKPLSTE